MTSSLAFVPYHMPANWPNLFVSENHLLWAWLETMVLLAMDLSFAWGDGPRDLLKIHKGLGYIL
jgi:hypothetical protein